METVAIRNQKTTIEQLNVFSLFICIIYNATAMSINMKDPFPCLRCLEMFKFIFNKDSGDLILPRSGSELVLSTPNGNLHKFDINIHE